MKKTIIFYILLAYIVFLICLGILNGNFYKYIFFDIHIYASLVFLTFFSRDSSVTEHYDKIPKLFAKLLIISIPVASILFILFGSFNLKDTLGRSLLNNMNLDFDEKMFMAPIIIAPLIVPFVNRMSRSLKYIVLFANTLVLIYGAITATRSVIIVSLIAFLSIINIRLKIKENRLYLILISVIVLTVFSITNKKVNTLIRSKIDFAISRFEFKGTFTNGRNTEVEGLFKEYNTFELIFGRGAGAEQKFGFWKTKLKPQEHGINFTHFGFLYLILKGGFILLFIVYGLALYSLYILFRRGERPYFFVILIYLVYELSHTQFINYFYLLFLWLGISYALNLSMYKQNINFVDKRIMAVS
jgi:hypothetical protein